MSSYKFPTTLIYNAAKCKALKSIHVVTQYQKKMFLTKEVKHSIAWKDSVNRKCPQYKNI